LTRQGSVLIVDDDPLQREIGAELLIGAGYACRVAEDGDVALRRLAEGPADVVVLDMIMPNREGIETLSEIRRRWPKIRVVMISAGTRVMTAGSLLETASALGADAVLAKPLRAETFLPLIAQMFADQAA
jgi:CheY-like chemotaxis protein